MKSIRLLCFFTFLFINSFCMAQSKVTISNNGFKSKDTKIFGYIANVPQELLGFNFVKLTSTNLGFYIDLKAGLPMRDGADDFYDNISINKAENIFGDQLLKKDDNWLSMNAGLTKILSNHIAFYGGLGFSIYSEYRQYKDEFEILGDNGKYWIENEDKSKTTLNVLGGIIFKINPTWIMQIGAEAQPSGISVGFGKILDI